MRNNCNYPTRKISKAPLLKVRQNAIIPMLDSSVANGSQRVPASQAACLVSLAKRGFATISNL